MGIFTEDEPEPIEVNGRPLSCVVCENGTFHQRRAQLHGPVATLSSGCRQPAPA
jgi:hypothetical protein